MNFSKCCKCGSNKDILYFHTEEREVICYECLKEYYKDVAKVVKEDGKEFYVWKNLDYGNEIKEDNMINFANEFYDETSNQNYWTPSVEECFYCEVCVDELCKKELMFIVYDEKYNQEYTICPECFAKLNGIKKIVSTEAKYACNRRYDFVYDDDIVVKDFKAQQDEGVAQKILDYCATKLNIEFIEEEVVKTDLTKFWTNTPRFYKVTNKKYNDIENKIDE